MNALLIELKQTRDGIDAVVRIEEGYGAKETTRELGTLYGLTLQDARWLLLANTAESDTPFVVDVAAS